MGDGSPCCVREKVKKERSCLKGWHRMREKKDRKHKQRR